MTARHTSANAVAVRRPIPYPRPVQSLPNAHAPMTAGTSSRRAASIWVIFKEVAKALSEVELNRCSHGAQLSS